jgi:hypothetical protein
MLRAILYVMLGRFIVDVVRWGHRRYKAWRCEHYVRDLLWHADMDGRDTKEIRRQLDEAYGTNLSER